jgi:Mrp family chromosome partitioning ATPase
VASRNDPATEPQQLAHRLALAARAGFVGRTQECALFRTALAAGSTTAVIQIYGPGGVGKTMLLREFARLAAAAGRPVVALDARHMRPSKRGVLQAFGDALACDVRDARTVPVPDRAVVIIDTCERLRALDPWLRDTIVPALPAGVLVVFGGVTGRLVSGTRTSRGHP